MAPLLKAGLHALRCSRIVSSPSLPSQRELGLLKPPESNYIVWRWYGESSALEEPCSATRAANDTAGESRAANGADSSKVVSITEKRGALKETLTVNAVKKEGAAEESSVLNTDKLASLILGKMRNKNNSNGPKDNGVPMKAESTSSSANKVSEEISESVKDDKWQQVVNSMRNMAAKKKGELASGGAKPTLLKRKEGEKQDDFADLDLPQAGGEAGTSKIFNSSDKFSRVATDVLKNFSLNAKPKDGGFQGSNAKQKEGGFEGYQPKAKEAKPVSFSFLKALDANATASGPQISGDQSFLDRNAGTSTADLLSNIKPKDSRSQGSNQPMRKETKPVSFDFLKPYEAKRDSSYESRNAPFNEAKNTSSHEAKSAPYYGAKSVSSHDLKGAFSERQDRAPPTVNEVSSNVSRTTYPGNTVRIQCLPSHSNLALVKEALSLHGEVISSFKKSNPDGSCSAFIEFKTAEALEGALASRWVQLDSKAYSIVRADLPITTVVRLSKVSAETTESQLTSICEKFGSIDNIRRRGNGVYDVYYKERELSNMPTILDSLNEVTLNQRRWLALPAPLLHPAMRKEVLNSSDGQAWHASQLSQTLHRIKTGLDTVSVYFEDLKVLTAMEDEMTK